MTSGCSSARCVLAATLLAAGGWAMAQAEIPPAAPAASAPEALVIPNTHPAADSASAITAPVSVTPTRPAWVETPILITSRTTVSRVIPGKPADVIILRDGLSQGFRDGLLCVVERNTSSGKINVAEVIVVATQPDQCAALITWPDDQTYQKNPIQPDDQVRLELH